MSVELRDYQQERLKYHLLHDRSICMLGTGLGKTPLFSVYSRIQFDCFHIGSVWVQPTSLLTKNRDDLIRFGDFKEEELGMCNTTPEKRQKLYENPNIKVYLMSFDCFAKEWQDLPERIGAVIVDEFHLGFSSHDSQRTQSFYRASRRFKKIKMLSATLVRDRYSSAYPAIAVAESRFYGTFNSFMRFHGIYDRWNHVVGYRNGDRLRAVLERLCCGLKDPQTIKKAPIQFITEHCNFDETQKEAYKELEEEGLLELEDEFLDCRGNGAVKAIRARQVLSTPEKLGLKIKFNGKLEMIKTHLENLKFENERAVIFSCFVDEQMRIKELCDSMGVRAEILNGSVSSTKRAEIDKKFQQHKLDVIIASEVVASAGYNWGFIQSEIFASLDYMQSNLKQSLGRGDRGDRTRPLLVFNLSYGTRIERRILQIIARKNQELKNVLDIEN